MPAWGWWRAYKNAPQAPLTCLELSSFSRTRHISVCQEPLDDMRFAPDILEVALDTTAKMIEAMGISALIPLRRLLYG